MHLSKLRIQLNGQILFAQRLMDWNQIVVVATFYGAFPFKVHNHSTLLGLQRIMTTRGHQTFDDMIKCVVIVVEQNHMPFIAEDDFRKDIFLSINFCSKEMSRHFTEIFVTQR